MLSFLRLIFFMMLSLVWVGSASAEDPPRRDISRDASTEAAPSGRRVALLIGVDDYDDPAIRDLEFAASDARELQRALLESGSFLGKDIILMTPDQPNAALRPTRANVLKQLVALEQSGEMDLLLVYFSGHGTAADTDMGRRNYLYPQDTVPVVLEETGIGVEDLLTRLERMSARGRVVIFDACRGDPGAAKSAGETGFADERYDSRGMKILFSAEFGKPSYEDPTARQGLFTRHLLDALEGRADGFKDSGPLDGVVSVAEVYAYTLERMKAVQPGGPEQVPVLDGELVGLDLALLETRADLEPVSCPADAAALDEALAAAANACQAPDSLDFLNAWRHARDTIRCAGVPVTPTQAARWHALTALRAQAQSRLPEAAATLRAARLIEQRLQLRGLLPATCAPSPDLELAASQITLSARPLDPLPAGARLLVDGAPAEELYNELPAVLQLQWSRSDVLEPALRRPGEKSPDYAALVPPEETLRIQRARRLAWSAGGAAVVAGGLLWAGLDAQGTLEDRAEVLNRDGASMSKAEREAGQTELESGQRRVNALGYGAQAAGVVALGLGGFAVTVRF